MLDSTKKIEISNQNIGKFCKLRNAKMVICTLNFNYVYLKNINLFSQSIYLE